ncbi:MAG: glycosyltransferase [Eubacteriales bacterium]|nr:glycosyltransferase [Eubacteriales bacterium]
MRILQINSFCGVASTGRIAKDIHTLLQAQGHESLVAFGRKPSKYCQDGFKFAGDLSFLLHVAYTFATDRQSFASVLATRRLIQKIADYQPDLVHLHIAHGYYVNIKILFDYLKKINIPVVWTQHDCWAFTGHCGYFDYAHCDRWKTECHHCPEKYRYPISLLLDNSRRNYRDKKNLFTGLANLVLVSPSYWLKGLIEDSYLKSYPVRVIPNGVNLAVFKPHDNDFRQRYHCQDRYVILAVATAWGKRKGLPSLLELTQLLTADEILVMVGLDPHQKKQIPKGVIGITRTHDVRELADIYAAADVFINPTLEDNFPTTNLEALASGTPVVTYRTGGSIESIDAATGLIAEQGNVQDLLAKIRQIKANGKATYTRACREKAESAYNSQDNFHKYIDLYRDLLGEALGPRDAVSTARPSSR